MKLLWCLSSLLLLSTATTALSKFHVGNAQFEVGDKTKLTVKRDNVDILTGYLYHESRSESDELSLCSNSADDVCLQWKNSNDKEVTLRVNKKDENDCYVVNFNSTEPNGQLYACFVYGDSQWYGGAERWEQEWPVQKMNFSTEPFITRPENSQAVLEPYWINSNGLSLYVLPGMPLFFDSNNIMQGGLCLVAASSAPYRESNITRLDHEICVNDDPKKGHLEAVKNYLGKPSDTPDELMVKYPIFSTWARYKADINEAVVWNFMQEINNTGFPISNLEIDDKWEICYGSSVFDEKKFQNIKSLTDSIREYGARVTLWIYPFINEDCEPYFSDAKAAGRFVQDENGNIMHNWWNGRGASVDFTNETTSAWWVQRTKDMITAAGIDSLKFDAGESGFLPQRPVLDVEDDVYPDIYTQKYVEAVNNFPKFLEIRVGRRTQSYPLFVRMLDKDSRWGFNNGLQSLVTTLLQMNMVGYPYVLPDMIGGNSYGNSIANKELFIRWLQANTFMPTMQFSVVPWDFDDETITISKKFVDLHAQYADRILAAAQQTVEDGSPVNAPLWWIAPTDPIALEIWDEFLLGSDIVVAPVLEEGARQRNIYLPEGLWNDMTRTPNTVVNGSQWLLDYPVALDELPFFERVKLS